MSYTVSQSHGCKVLEGEVPLVELGFLLRAWDELGADPETDAEGWIVDAKLSEWLGVTLVCGPRRATEAWRAELMAETKEST